MVAGGSGMVSGQRRLSASPSASVPEGAGGDAALDVLLPELAAGAR